MRRIRHRVHDLQHGVHREPVRRVDRELGALGAIAAHFDEAAQRGGLERADQFRGPAPERCRFSPAGVLQLVGDLQQIADDDLIVGRVLLILVDRLGDHGRLGRRRVVSPAGIRREGGTRQTEPQLCAAQTPLPGAFVLGRRRSAIFLQQLEALVGDGMQSHVVPCAQLLRSAEPERLPGAFRVDRERLEHIHDFAHPQPAVERDGAKVVAMQPSRELRQQRVLRIGRDALDDELLASHTQRQRRALFEQMFGSAGGGRGGGGERRVALRVHRVLVEGNRELDQKIGQLSRESGLFGRRRPGHGSPR